MHGEFSRMKLNASWHTQNPMPKNASLEMRIQWHIEYTKNCACTEIPLEIQRELPKRKIKIQVP